MSFNIDLFESRLKEIPFVEVKSQENEIVVESKLIEKNYVLIKEELQRLLDQLKKDKSSGFSLIALNNYYESLVRDESNYSLLLSRKMDSGGIKIVDSDNDLNYMLSYPSQSFLIKFLLLNQIDYKKSIFRHRFRFRIDKDDDFWLYLSRVFSLNTLKIEASANTKFEDFRSYAKAFLFNLNYNVGAVYVETDTETSSDKFLRLQRYRRSKVEELDPPRRLYQNELVDHFLMAQSSSNVMAIFLSYYHIIEFYFIQVFEENLIKQVKQKITSSSFSYKKDKEIRGLIKYISKQMKIQDDDRYSFSELEALILVLSKMVNFNLVREELNQYDQSLIDYYKSSTIFSKGNSLFDFNELEVAKDKIIKSISQRIYGIRNAIVHSKDGGGDAYTPFKDDKKLLQEIPLLRFIAEEVINYNSEIIE